MSIQELYLRYSDKFDRLARGDSLLRIGHIWYGADEDSTVASIRSISDKKISTVFPIRAESSMSFTSSEAPTDAVIIQVIVHYSAFDSHVKELLAFSLCSPVVQVINPVISALTVPIAHNTDFYISHCGLPAKEIEHLVSGDAYEIRSIYSKAIVPMVINNIAIQTMDETAENISITFQLTRVKGSGGAALEGEKPQCYLKNIEDVHIQAGILNKLKNYGGDTKGIDVLANAIGINSEKYRSIVEELRLEDIARKPGSTVIDIPSPVYDPVVETGKWLTSFGVTAAHLTDRSDRSAFNEVLPEGGFSPEVTYDIADCKYFMYLVKYIANTITSSQLEKIESDIGGKIQLPYDRFKKVSYDELTKDQTFEIATQYSSQKVISDTISKNIEVFDLSTMFYGSDAPGTNSDKLVSLVNGASAICQDYYSDKKAGDDPLLSRALVSITPGAEVDMTLVINVAIWKISRAINACKDHPENNNTMTNVLKQARLFKDYCARNNIKVTISDGLSDGTSSSSIWDGLSVGPLSKELVWAPDPSKNIDPNKPDAAVGLTNPEFGELISAAIKIANEKISKDLKGCKFSPVSVRRTILQQYAMYVIGREPVEICRKLLTLAGISPNYIGDNHKLGDIWSGDHSLRAPHIQGRAVDISPNVYFRKANGQRDYAKTYKYLVDAVRDLATKKKMPVVWGGDFILIKGDNDSRDWPHFEYHVGSKTMSNPTLNLTKYSKYDSFDIGLTEYAKSTGTLYPDSTPSYDAVIKSVKNMVGGYGTVAFKGANTETVRAEYEKLFAIASHATDDLLSGLFIALRHYLKIDLSKLVEHIDISYTPGASVPIPLEGSRSPVVQCMGGRQVDVNVTFKVTDLVDIAKISTLFGISSPVQKVISMLHMSASVFKSDGSAMGRQRLGKIYDTSTRQQIYQNLREMTGKTESVDLDEPIFISNTFLNGLGFNTFVATGYNVSTIDAITNGFNVTINFSYANMRYRSNETLMKSKLTLAENILPYALRIPFIKMPNSDDTISVYDGEKKYLGWQGSIDSAQELRFYKEIAASVQNLGYPELLGTYIISKMYDLYVGLSHIRDYSEMIAACSPGKEAAIISIPSFTDDFKRSIKDERVIVSLMEYGRLINENGTRTRSPKATLKRIAEVVNKTFDESGLGSGAYSGDMVGTFLADSSRNLGSDIAGKAGSALFVTLADSAISSRLAAAKVIKAESTGAILQQAGREGSKLARRAKIAGAAVAVALGAASAYLAYTSATRVSNDNKKNIDFTLGLLCPIMSHMLMSEFIDAMHSGPGNAKAFISGFSTRAYRVLTSADSGITYDPKNASFKFNVTDMSSSLTVKGELPITSVTLAMSTGFAAAMSPEKYPKAFKNASEEMAKISADLNIGDAGVLQTFSCLLGMSINILATRAIRYFSSLDGVTTLQMLTETSGTISGKPAYATAATTGVDHAYQILMGVFSQQHIPDIAIDAIINLSNNIDNASSSLVGFPLYDSLAAAARYYKNEYVVISGKKVKYKLTRERMVGMFIEDAFYDTGAIVNGNPMPNVLREAIVGFTAIIMTRATDFAIDGEIYSKTGKRSTPGETPEKSDGYGTVEIKLSELIKSSSGANLTMNGLYIDCASAGGAAYAAVKEYVNDIIHMAIDPMNLASLLISVASLILKTVGVALGSAIIAGAGTILSIIAIVAFVVTIVYFAAIAILYIAIDRFRVTTLKSMFSLSIWLAGRLAEGLDRSRILSIFNSAGAWSLTPLKLDNAIYDSFNSAYPDYPTIAMSARSVYGTSFASNQEYIPIAPDGYIYHLLNIQDTLSSLEIAMNNLITVAANAAPKNLYEAYQQIKTASATGVQNDLKVYEEHVASTVSSCFTRKGNKNSAKELAEVLNDLATITKDGDYSPCAFYVTVGTVPAAQPKSYDNNAGIGIYLTADTNNNVTAVNVMTLKTATFFGPAHDDVEFNKWKCLRDRIRSNKLYSVKNSVSSAIGFQEQLAEYYAKELKDLDSIEISQDGLYMLFNAIVDMCGLLMDVSLANMNVMLNNMSTSLSDVETIRNLVSSTFAAIGTPGLQQFRLGMGEVTLKNMYQATRYVSGYSFPTVKLYFIEQDQEAWYLFDDVYSYTSVIDIAVSSHINRPTSFALLRVTNLHGNLSNIAADKYNREGIFTKSQSSNTELNAIFIKPGCKIKIQMGMDSILTDADTVFCGEISSIDFGPVTTIEAVSYGNIFNTVLAGEKATVYGKLGYLGGFIGKAFAAFGEFIDYVMAKWFVGIPGDYSLNKAKSITDIISNIFSDSTETLSAISDFTIDPSLMSVSGIPTDESLFLNTQSALMANKFMPELSSQFADITGVSLGIHVNKQLYENVSILGSSDVEFRASNIASTLSKANVDGKGAWVIYNQTIWDALQEVNLMIPNRLLLIRPYETRGTLVWGSSDDYYRFKRTVDINSVVSTLTYERSKSFCETGAVGAYKLLDKISNSATFFTDELTKDNATILTSMYNIITSIVYYAQKQVSVINIKGGVPLTKDSLLGTKEIPITQYESVVDFMTKDTDITELIDSLKSDNSLDSKRQYALVIYRSFVYLCGLSFKAASKYVELSQYKNIAEREIYNAKEGELNELLRKKIVIALKTADLVNGIFENVTKWKTAKQDLIKESKTNDVTSVYMNRDDVPGVCIYMFETAYSSLMEHIRHAAGARSTSYRKVSDIHIKVSGRDIVKNDLVLQMPFNTVSLDYPPSFSSTPDVDSIIRQGEDELNNIVVPIHYKLRDSVQRRYNTYFKNINAFPGTRISLRNAVAVNILTNLIKDTYSGSITLLGDAAIKEGDRLLIWDENNDIFGFVRVRSHTMTMNANDGFISTIEPEMISLSSSYIEKDAKSAAFALLGAAMWVGAAAVIGKNVGVFSKRAAAAYRLRLAAQGLGESKRAKVAEAIEKHAPTTMAEAVIFPASMGLCVVKKVYRSQKKALNENSKNLDISGEQRMSDVNELIAALNAEKLTAKGVTALGVRYDLGRAMLRKGILTLRNKTLKGTISAMGYVPSKIYSFFGPAIKQYFGELFESFGKNADEIARRLDEGCMSVYDLPLIDLQTKGLSSAIKPTVSGTNAEITVKHVLQGEDLSFARSISDAEAETFKKELTEAMDLSLKHETIAGKTYHTSIDITFETITRNKAGAITGVKPSVKVILSDADMKVAEITGKEFRSVEKRFSDHIAAEVSRKDDTAEGVDEVVEEYTESEVFILQEFFNVSKSFFLKKSNETYKLNKSLIKEMFEIIEGQVVVDEFVKNAGMVYSRALLGHFGMRELFKAVSSKTKAHFVEGTTLEPVLQIRRFYLKDEVFTPAFDTHCTQLMGIGKVRTSSDEAITIADHLYDGIKTADSTKVTDDQVMMEKAIIDDLVINDAAITDASKIDISSRAKWFTEDINTLAKDEKILLGNDPNSYIPRKCYIEMGDGYSRLATPDEIVAMIAESPESASEFAYIQKFYSDLIALRKRRLVTSKYIDPLLDPANGVNLSQGKTFSKTEFDNIADALDSVLNTKGSSESIRAQNGVFKEIKEGNNEAVYELTEVGAAALKEHLTVASKLSKVTPSKAKMSIFGTEVKKPTVATKARELKDTLTKILGTSAVTKDSKEAYAHLFKKNGDLDEEAFISFLKKAIDNGSSDSMKKLIDEGDFVKLTIAAVNKQMHTAGMSNAEVVESLRQSVIDILTKAIADDLIKSFGNDTKLGKMFADSKSEPYVKLKEYVSYMADDIDGKFTENCQESVARIQPLSVFERKVLQAGIKQAENPATTESLKSLGANIFAAVGAYWAADSMLNAVQNLTDLSFSVPQTADMVTINPLFFRGNPMVVGLDGMDKKDQDNPGVVDVLLGSRFSIFGNDIVHSFTDPLILSQQELWEQRYANGTVKATTGGASNITPATINKDIYGMEKEK